MTRTMVSNWNTQSAPGFEYTHGGPSRGEEKVIGGCFHFLRLC